MARSSPRFTRKRVDIVETDASVPGGTDDDSEGANPSERPPTDASTAAEGDIEP